MLREAVLCGLKLEAVGVCLQPAIYLHPAVVASGHIPTELIQILKEELRGERVEFETETRVRSLVDQHLPHGRLVEILDLAAGYDAGVTSQEVFSDTQKRRLSESRAEERRRVSQEVVRDAEKRKEVDARSEAKAGEAKSAPDGEGGGMSSSGDQEVEEQSDIETDHGHDVDPKGLPICPDGLKLGTDSLKGIWWLLEGLILQTRRYEGKSGVGKDVWR